MTLFCRVFAHCLLITHATSKFPSSTALFLCYDTQVLLAGWRSCHYFPRFTLSPFFLSLSLAGFVILHETCTTAIQIRCCCCCTCSEPLFWVLFCLRVHIHTYARGDFQHSFPRCVLLFSVEPLLHNALLMMHTLVRSPLFFCLLHTARLRDGGRRLNRGSPPHHGPDRTTGRDVGNPRLGGWLKRSPRSCSFRIFVFIWLFPCEPDWSGLRSCCVP